MTLIKLSIFFGALTIAMAIESIAEYIKNKF